MCSTFIFTCIMKMVPNFMICFIFTYLSSNYSLQIYKIFTISFDSCCCFVNKSIFFFLKSIIFIVCSLKDSQNFIMQSLPLYTSCFFSLFLNVDIVDIEKSDGICSPILLYMTFQDYFYIHQFFSIKHSKSA